MRVYTVNKGQMDDWLKLWTEEIAPLHARLGIDIEGAWLYRPQNEFVWVRSFADEADMERKLRLFQESPERQAMGERLRAHIAKIEVSDAEPVAFERMTAVQARAPSA